MKTLKNIDGGIKMKIYLSADKDGFNLKEVIKTYLTENDFTVVDLAETPAEDFVESANNLAAIFFKFICLFTNFFN